MSPAPERRQPCPFCGNPHINLSPLHAGPVRRYRVRGHTRRDLGPLVGYEAGCGLCWATLRRRAATEPTQAAVRRAALAAWNARAGEPALPAGLVPVNARGFRPCPLCGSLDIEEIAAAPLRSGHRAFFASGVACRGCGLTLIPGAGSCGVHASRTAAELRDLWNRRALPAPPAPPDAPAAAPTEASAP